MAHGLPVDGDARRSLQEFPAASVETGASGCEAPRLLPLFPLPVRDFFLVRPKRIAGRPRGRHAAGPAPGGRR